ncbi:hypothetical protein DMA12_01750 [Amycolatopsis balhimycina DSM 5908]|uniref:AB hydrolase-1 domain-containing protein n=1 Tax=Amycolatopsis balhimycina DSM 5908 TaxID=1081091 RepID=A0A428X6E4_AMYBA|nr:hypothetical protein DMA12_01750 [Amycolatopsis balhimycina DSM 5908]
MLPVPVYRSPLSEPGATGGITTTVADESLLRVVSGGVRTGTWLNPATARFPAVVLGQAAAERLGVVSPGTQVWLGGRYFTVVGMLEPVALAPDLDRAALIGAPVATELFGFDGSPTTVYERSADAAVDLRIEISRTKASDPALRQGVVLLNPGGPGGGGLAMPLETRGSELARHFDVIGFDPRGVGRSSALKCERIPDTRPATSRPADAGFTAFAEYARAHEAACRPAGGGIRPFINTANTARDMDVIRAALGESRINYLGYSYGTYLGAVYGSLFPRRLNRSVLDSSVHPSWLWREQAEQQSVANRFNVEQWATWVGRRDRTYHLGKSPVEVRPPPRRWRLSSPPDRFRSPAGGRKTGPATGRTEQLHVPFLHPAGETRPAEARGLSGRRGDPGRRRPRDPVRRRPRDGRGAWRPADFRARQRQARARRHQPLRHRQNRRLPDQRRAATVEVGMRG